MPKSARGAPPGPRYVRWSLNQGSAEQTPPGCDLPEQDGWQTSGEKESRRGYRIANPDYPTPTIV